MENILDTLRARGFVKQTVYEEDLYKLLGSESVPFYIGFDPTADSLHVGHFVQLMVMSWLQKAGHKPIILIGGGTAMVGDPSGRTDMRAMMTKETIAHNVECFKVQMSKFLDFTGENAAIIVNNADWLLDLNYVDFLRDIGAYFSVNRMLTAECFKSRMEKGLSFLEFNYMLMQGYDFLVLHDKYGVKLQCGGDDQWSNILAGADLIRRKSGDPAYAMTFELLTTSEGKKMGKTAKGAIWIDKDKTTPYDFYQYWRNVDDADVEKCLRLLTFMPMEQIRELTKYQDERINEAKRVLAYEVTSMIHGKDEADKVEAQVKAAFSGVTSNMATATVKPGRVVDILVEVKFAPSKGEARRLIEGGGVRIGDDKVTDVNAEITEDMLKGECVLYKGKKNRIKLVL